MSKLFSMSKPQEITEYMWTTWAQRNNLTNCQDVGGVSREGWDLRWEVERLQKIIIKRESEITALRFDNAMLKAELNATRGKR